ncbi:hypothetical protein ASG25_21140 [Rhizobium sp. Leaf384]|uniref:hypothetical protein n=1 Tax=unclassified Rhizobium TaxID=2613769 RepID=UPI0007128E48|nr:MULTISPECIES: hypothetical protein [unclassified Rhizobium]KQS74304.1 hypothetical protein ASG25_21140 [Rhizobium sp. Leaf384]KQS83947.1 hypothetical protein ASG58_21520 [Rhizobium sp. Leaf383]
MTSDRYPLRPDSDWYDALVAAYGEEVPAIARMRFRRGLQSHVDAMDAQLKDLGLLPHVDILSITSRGAGYVVIYAKYQSGIYEDDRIALDFCFERHAKALREACEHCGTTAEIVVKIGMEALLANPSIDIGDRCLCSPCADAFQKECAR